MCVSAQPRWGGTCKFWGAPPTSLFPYLDLLFDELLGVVDLLGGATDDEEFEIGVPVGGQLAGDLHEGPRLLVDGFDVLPACGGGGTGGSGGGAHGGELQRSGEGVRGVLWIFNFILGRGLRSPLPMTSPHLWVGMEKVISPPGGPQLPWPLPRPRPPGGIPGPGGPGGPLCGGKGGVRVGGGGRSPPFRGAPGRPPPTRRLWRRSLMMRAACSQRSGGPMMWAIFSGPVPSSGKRGAGG